MTKKGQRKNRDNNQGTDAGVFRHRIRATLNNERQTVIKAIVTHPMETGRRRDRVTGKIIPANYISEVIVKRNGIVELTVYWGPSTSKDPLLQFKLKGGIKGDKIEFLARDNHGNKGSFTTIVQ